MKIIINNTSQVFRRFSYPSNWRYDCIGTYFTGAEAWAAGGGVPVYYIFGQNATYGVYYKSSQNATPAGQSISDGDIIRIFPGALYLQFIDGVYKAISEREEENIQLSPGAYYYNASTNRVSSEKVSQGGYECCSIDVVEGDIIAYKGIGGNSPRILAWQNDSQCIVQQANFGMYSDKGYMYYLVPGDGKIYFNSATNKNHECKIYRINP